MAMIFIVYSLWVWKFSKSNFSTHTHTHVRFLPVIFFCCKNSPFCYNDNSRATWSKEHFENFPPKIITFQVRKLWNW
jgi:hypothetical protein